MPIEDRIKGLIVDDILNDIIDLQGFSQAWDEVDPEIQFEIIDRWEEIVAKHLKGALERAQEDAEYRIRLDVPMELLAAELSHFDSDWPDEKIVYQAVEDLKRLKKEVEKAHSRARKGEVS